MSELWKGVIPRPAFSPAGRGISSSYAAVC
jgi:hypothetical protein